MAVRETLIDRMLRRTFPHLPTSNDPTPTHEQRTTHFATNPISVGKGRLLTSVVRRFERLGIHTSAALGNTTEDEVANLWKRRNAKGRVLALHIRQQAVQREAQAYADLVL